MTAYETSDGRHWPVRKIDTEKLQRCIELVASGILKQVDQAAALEVSPSTIHKWKVRSSKGDPQLEAEFFGEVMQFGAAYRIATRLAYLELRATAEQFSIHGRKRRTLNQGQFVVALDPAAIPLDRETRILCGYHPDALMLDERGHATFVEEHVDAPIGLVTKFLETFVDLQPTAHQDINIRGALQVGVGIAPKTDYTREPPPLPPAPEIPQLEVLPAADAVALAELLGEGADVEPADVEPADGYTDPRTAVSMAVEPQAGVGVDPLAIPAREPRSPLEADLFAKLREARERVAKKGTP